MPRKPTNPFGHIDFSKSKRLTKHMEQLSHVKEDQELQVVERFVESYNRMDIGPAITGIQPLAQDDHDAVASMDGIPLQIQVTELVEQMYTFEMTQEEYDAGNFQETAQLS